MNFTLLFVESNFIIRQLWLRPKIWCTYQSIKKITSIWRFSGPSPWHKSLFKKSWDNYHSEMIGLVLKCTQVWGVITDFSLALECIWHPARVLSNYFLLIFFTHYTRYSSSLTPLSKIKDLNVVCRFLHQAS